LAVLFKNVKNLLRTNQVHSANVVDTEKAFWTFNPSQICLQSFSKADGIYRFIYIINNCSKLSKIT